ncbi:MAG: hypothetical protein L0Y72_16275, partial [Gemmataceae bacterium]|nr:hypothetical protein [Gemmataceae bacterium]
LPNPAKDLLDQGDQLANYLRKHLQADGSMLMEEPDPSNTEGRGTTAVYTHEAAQHFSGPALYGIIKSHTLRPAAWKLEALRKARTHYHGYWKQNKNVPMCAWHCPAYAEAFVLTKEQAFADAAFEMCDWLCGLQYAQVDPRRAQWLGGFMPWRDGKTWPVAPDIGSAGPALALAEGCRLAKLTGDVQRHQRYRPALEQALQFLTSLQYNEANTQHFAEWYRSALLGGFHAAPEDGNLRLDYTHVSLAGLVQYLDHVADLPK